MTADPKPVKRIKRREQKLDKEAAERWKITTLALFCVCCGKRAAHGHHAVSQQQIRLAGLGEDVRWALRNLVPLCEDAHRGHHTRLRPIPFSALPASVIEFAEEYGFMDYLRRTYP